MAAMTIAVMGAAMTTRTIKKDSPNRGAKIFIGALSVAATLSGWAWLTLTNEADAEVVQDPAPITDLVIVPTVAPANTRLPSLSNLPVRGLRVVGAATRAAPVQAPPSNNANGQGAAVQEQPQPQQQAPEPRPKPVRKTQSSR